LSSQVGVQGEVLISRPSSPPSDRGEQREKAHIEGGAEESGGGGVLGGGLEAHRGPRAGLSPKPAAIGHGVGSGDEGGGWHRRDEDSHPLSEKVNKLVEEASTLSRAERDSLLIELLERAPTDARLESISGAIGRLPSRAKQTLFDGAIEQVLAFTNPTVVVSRSSAPRPAHHRCDHSVRDRASHVSWRASRTRARCAQARACSRADSS